MVTPGNFRFRGYLKRFTCHLKTSSIENISQGNTLKSRLPKCSSVLLRQRHAVHRRGLWPRAYIRLGSVLGIVNACQGIVRFLGLFSQVSISQNCFNIGNKLVAEWRRGYAVLFHRRRVDQFTKRSPVGASGCNRQACPLC